MTKTYRKKSKTKKRKEGKKQRRITSKYKGGTRAAEQQEEHSDNEMKRRRADEEEEEEEEEQPRNKVFNANDLHSKISNYLPLSNVIGKPVPRYLKVRDNKLNKVATIKPKDNYRKWIHDYNLTFLKNPAFINITLIDLNFTNITDDSLRIIAKYCPYLTIIYLKSTFITDNGIKALANEEDEQAGTANFRATNTYLDQFIGCPNLTTINMSDTGITDDGLQTLVPKYLFQGYLKAPGPLQTVTNNDTGIISSGCPNLTNIYLRDTNIHDNGLIELANGCHNLTIIDLRGTNITNISVLEIAVKCKQLITIDLRDCTNLTFDAIRTLVTTCRTLKHLGYDFDDAEGDEQSLQQLTELLNIRHDETLEVF